MKTKFAQYEGTVLESQCMGVQGRRIREFKASLGCALELSWSGGEIERKGRAAQENKLFPAAFASPVFDGTRSHLIVWTI